MYQGSIFHSQKWTPGTYFIIIYGSVVHYPNVWVCALYWNYLTRYLDEYIFSLTEHRRWEPLFPYTVLLNDWCPERASTSMCLAVSVHAWEQWTVQCHCQPEGLCHHQQSVSARRVCHWGRKHCGCYIPWDPDLDILSLWWFPQIVVS